MRPRVLRRFVAVQETHFSVGAQRTRRPFAAAQARRKTNPPPCAQARRGGWVPGFPYGSPRRKKWGAEAPHRRGDPYGNRTHVFAVRGRCLSLLTNGPCSSDWRNVAIIAWAGGKCQYLFCGFCKKVKNAPETAREESEGCFCANATGRTCAGKTERTICGGAAKGTSAYGS